MRITEEIRQHLAVLEVDGRLTPERVLTDAKRPDSPLHKHFQWDNEKAAEQHRLDQARTLIRTVKINLVINEVRIKAPFYIPDPSNSGREQGYSTVERLREDVVAARQALIAECERASAILRRARLVALAIGMDAEVDNVLMQVGMMRTRLENGPSEQTQ